MPFAFFTLSTLSTQGKLLVSGGQIIALCAWASVALPVQAAKLRSTPPVADLRQCVPAWPKQSLRNEETGTVIVAFQVDQEGRASDVAVSKSSGFVALDTATIAAIRQCEFKPATKNGKKVAAATKISFTWTLEDDVPTQAGNTPPARRQASAPQRQAPNRASIGPAGFSAALDEAQSCMRARVFPCAIAALENADKLAKTDSDRRKLRTSRDELAVEQHKWEQQTLRSASLQGALDEASNCTRARVFACAETALANAAKWVDTEEDRRKLNDRREQLSAARQRLLREVESERQEEMARVERVAREERQARKDRLASEERYAAMRRENERRLAEEEEEESEARESSRRAAMSTVKTQQEQNQSFIDSLNRGTQSMQNTINQRQVAERERSAERDRMARQEREERDAERRRDSARELAQRQQSEDARIAAARRDSQRRIAEEATVQNDCADYLNEHGSNGADLNRLAAESNARLRAKGIPQCKRSNSSAPAHGVSR
jgi:TonB family protein